MPTNTPTPVKGTQPEGAQTEVDASRKVREMFTQIAPRYDLLNHLLSFQLDRLWRTRAAYCLRPILERNFPLVLDSCCGTGDLGITMARAFTPRVIGADFAFPMLIRVKEKSSTLRGKNLVQLRRPKFVGADALRLPFWPTKVSISSPPPSVSAISPTTKPASAKFNASSSPGTIAICEFTEPPDSLLGDIYRWYFCKVLPRIGGLISGDSSAYTYLPKSVARFLPAELASRTTLRLGYQSVAFKVWTFGTVALHTAVRPR